MWKCPSCSKENSERICPACGFDQSKDFIAFRTVSYVPPNDAQMYQKSFDGIRKEVYDDGSWYEGEFKDGKRHGHGTYVYSNKDRYVGEFYEGMRHGKCVYYCWSGEVYIRMFFWDLKYNIELPKKILNMQINF